MFFYVQPVEVWSKCGPRGRVKEPVGTHGKTLFVILRKRFYVWFVESLCLYMWTLHRGNEMHIQWSGAAT